MCTSENTSLGCNVINIVSYITITIYTYIQSSTLNGVNANLLDIKNLWCSHASAQHKIK
jgi:hypothetical protein